MTKRKPGKITVYWHKDAMKVSLYAHGKKLILLRNIFAEPIEELIAPFCEGWFGTEDRTQWRYSVKFA